MGSQGKSKHHLLGAVAWLYGGVVAVGEKVGDWGNEGMSHPCCTSLIVGGLVASEGDGGVGRSGRIVSSLQIPGCEGK